MPFLMLNHGRVSRNSASEVDTIANILFEIFSINFMRGGSYCVVNQLADNAYKKNQGKDNQS